MRRITAIFVTVLTFVALPIGAGWRSGSAQDTGLQATLAAQETTIAAQQTSIAELEGTVDARGAKINAQRTQIAELRATGATETLEPEAAANGSASPYLGGTGVSLLPAGEKGKIDVVLQGAYDGNILPIIIRNNSTEAIGRVTVSATARSSGGDLIAAGGDQGFNPNTVEPGGYTLGYIYFDQAALPSDTTFVFDVNYSSPDSGSFSAVDLSVVEASYLGDRIVGEFKNDSDVVVSGPIGISVVCLDASGAILSHETGFTDKDQAQPGESVPFQVAFYSGVDCTNFLVAGSGYSF